MFVVNLGNGVVVQGSSSSFVRSFYVGDGFAFFFGDALGSNFGSRLRVINNGFSLIYNYVRRGAFRSQRYNF